MQYKFAKSVQRHMAQQALDEEFEFDQLQMLPEDGSAGLEGIESDRDYKTRTIKDYGQASGLQHRSSPSKLRPADVESDSFSDIDDKMAQYRQRKNLPSKPLSGAGASGADSTSLRAPLQHARLIQDKAGSQKAPSEAATTHAVGKGSSVPSCSYPASIADRNSARGSTQGAAPRSQRTPNDVQEYINCYRSENRGPQAVDSSPESSRREAEDDDRIAILHQEISRQESGHNDQSFRDSNLLEQEKTTLNYTYDAADRGQQQLPSSHTSKTKAENGTGQNIKISTLLHKHSEKQRNKLLGSENSRSNQGERTLTQTDKWAFTSKFCAEEGSVNRSHHFAEESKSGYDDRTAEKVYESKKIQEYADRMLEQQHSTYTDMMTQNKLIDTGHRSMEMSKEFLGDHSTNKPELRQAGKIIKQLYRSSFENEQNNKSKHGPSNIDPNEYKTNINSLYLKEEAGSSQICNTVQEQTSPRRITAAEAIQQDDQATQSALRHHAADAHSPQLSFVDSTRDNNTSRRNVYNRDTTYLDSIDISLPATKEQEAAAEENSSDNQSQSSLKIRDILKYKKVGVPSQPPADVSQDARIEKARNDFHEIRAEHQEMQNIIRAGLYPNKHQQRSVQSTIHEVSNGCQIEDAEILMTNEKKIQKEEDVDNLENFKKFSFQEQQEGMEFHELAMPTQAVQPAQQTQEASQTFAANIKFLDDNGSEIDVQIQAAEELASNQIEQPEQSTAPVLQVFENPKYRQSTRSSHNRQASLRHSEQCSISVPDQNLMVVCFVKSAKRATTQSKSNWNATRVNKSKSNTRQNRFSSGVNSNGATSIASERSKSVYSARSARNGRNGLSNNHSGTNSSIFSFSEDNEYGTMGLTNPANQSTIQKRLKLLQHLKGPMFFTTQREASQMVFQQLSNLTASYKPQESQLISKNLIWNTLRYSKDCPMFLAGAYKNGKLDSIDDQFENTANLRLFNFDRCMSESQHSKKIIDDSKQFLRDWLIHSRVNQTMDSVFPNNDADDPILKFCFLFGSSATLKSEELNLMNKTSLIQEFLNDLAEPIRFLQISMFFQDQEFVLNNREFDSNKQSKREIGMEIREALRDRARLVNKLTEQQPNLALFIQKCSHFKIQLNNYVFIDMADLRGLQFFENEEVISTLTNDFGSMTNEILRQSIYYRDHSFQINEDQKLSSFNQFLRNNIQPQSKIMLLTFINNESEDLVSSQIALDFSHKIRQYFSGQSDECAIKNIIDGNRFDYDPVQLTESFEKLDQIFMHLEIVKRKSQKFTQKFQNTPALQMSKMSLRKMMRDYANLKEKFSRYQLSINQTLQNEIEKVLPLELFVDLNNHIDKDISTMKEELKDLGSNINKLSNRVLSLNSKTHARQTSNTFKSRLRSADRRPKVAGAAVAPNRGRMMPPANERSLSCKSSQVSLSNYNPLRGRMEQRQSIEVLGANQHMGNGNSTNELMMQQTTQGSVLVNLPIGQPVALEPQSIPQTEDSSSYVEKHTEENQHDDTQERARSRRQSSKQARQNQKKASTRLSRPKMMNANSRGRKEQKKERKQALNNPKISSRSNRKQSINRSQQDQEQFKQSNPSDVEQNIDVLTKDIDQSLQAIKNRHSNALNQHSRSFHRVSNVDLENVVTTENQEIDLQIIPGRHSATTNDQRARVRDLDPKNIEPTDQSMIAPNPFEQGEYGQQYASQRRSIDVSKGQAPNDYDDSSQILLNEPRQGHTSQPSDPSIYLLQNSYKSIDLLEGTTTKNQMLLVQQLQQKIHQLQQQMSFQKKEFDMKIEEKVMHSIQNREDLLQQLTTTKKELDNSNKEKHQMLSHFEGKTMQLKREAMQQIEQAKKEARTEARTQSIERIRKQVHSEVRQQVKNELFHTVKTQARNEMNMELRREIEKELKGKMYVKARKELYNEVYQEVQQKVKERARQEIVKDLRSELRKEIQEEIMKESNFNQINFELEQQQKVTQRLTTENQDLKRKLKEAESKSKKQDANKKNMEKLDQLQKKLHSLQLEKDDVEETNKQILSQVGLMKETIKESKERELVNIKLHEKLRDRQAKIDELKSREKQFVEQLEVMDKKLTSSREDERRLCQQISQLQKQVATLTAQVDQDDSIRQDHQAMEQQVQALSNELDAKNHQLDEQVEAFKDQIEEIKCARDRYRQQVLDQKQEVRKLKKRLSSQDRQATQDLSSSITARPAPNQVELQ